MEQIDSHTASARLQNLRGMLSAEYVVALDYVLDLIDRQTQTVDRELVVALLTQRAQSSGYLALQGVLFELAAAVGRL